MATTEDDSRPSASDDDEVRLCPPDCLGREEVSRRLEPVGNCLPPSPPAVPRIQFTIADVLVLMSALSLGLAGGTWIPVQLFAAVMGVVMLGGLVIVHMYPPEAHWARLLWWSLGLAYTVAVLAAVLNPSNT